MRFTWNEIKAAANFEKHGVSFEGARTLFDDPLFVDFYAPDHSEHEPRYILVGESNAGRWAHLIIVTRGRASEEK